MNRRGFLKGAGSAVVGIAAVAVASKAGAADADDFTHNGYRVRWGGWQVPANQDIKFGTWYAKHVTKDLAWASTTLGACYPSRAWEVVDTTLYRGWPRLDGFSTDAEFAAVKQRARAALLDALDAKPREVKPEPPKAFFTGQHNLTWKEAFEVVEGTKLK